MISPRVFISAQDASCDSRMMVEKPVRNKEFCISCTMPESEAFTTSRSMALTCIISLRHDQVFPFIHVRHLPWTQHGGAVELVEHGRTRNVQANVEFLALIHRAI